MDGEGEIAASSAREVGAGGTKRKGETEGACKTQDYCMCISLYMISSEVK
jgi:hypothetical protein